MREWLHSVLNLFYPPLCLHCGEPLSRNTHRFCPLCLSLLTLIDPQERCPRCFSPDFLKTHRSCNTCSKKPPPLTHMAAAFDHMGPAATLVQKMKYCGQPYLAKGAAAYMALQFHSLQWPLPDVIVPTPISLLRLFERGYNQSQELASALSPLLNRPAENLLKRRNGGYSQAGLTRKLRTNLDPSAFSLKKNARLHDKIILLVDDVTTTGSTLYRCAETLQEQCPQAIYALTVCRAAK